MPGIKSPWGETITIRRAKKRINVDSSAFRGHIEPTCCSSRIAKDLSPETPMLRLSYQQYAILIDNDPTFTFGSADNPRTYVNAYSLDSDYDHPSSQHSVRVLQDDGHESSSCILAATGGATGIHEGSAVVHAGSLLLAIGPYVVSLKLPSLTLNWKVQTDWATCFGVYHSSENCCFISHGEIDVAAVSYDGAIIWYNSGADIFTNGFAVSDTQVMATDWNDNKYVWDIATGKPIE